MQTSVLISNPGTGNTFARYINVCSTKQIRFSIGCVVNTTGLLNFAYAFLAGNTMFQSRGEKILLMVSTSLAIVCFVRCEDFEILYFVFSIK